MFDRIQANWWIFLVSGVISLLIGAALLIWPDKTVTVVASLIGLWILFFGVIRFVVSLFGGDTDSRWPMLIVGVLGIVLGIVVMRNPTETIEALAIIIGIFWVITGLMDVWRGLSNDFPERWWVAFGGLVAAGFGTALILWTEVTVTILAVIAGVFLLIEGVIEIIAAFQIKSASPPEVALPDTTGRAEAAG
jgi:uncharacterized membrane protein HdeD (DUF308 family)